MSKHFLKKPFIEHLKEKVTDKMEKESIKIENMSAASIISLLGCNIRTLRKIKGFTINGLSEKAKISATYLQLIEKNGKNVSINKINDIARALGVTANVLISENMDTYRKLFEISCRLKNYSSKDLIRIERLIEKIDDSIVREQKGIHKLYIDNRNDDKNMDDN